MDFDRLSDFLRVRLNEPMPGSAAHELMKPKLPNGKPVSINHGDPPRKGGVLILLFPDGAVSRFPMIQRPEYNGVHSGQMALPGGKMEESDSDLVETALREAEEEVGVDGSSIEVIGCLSEFYVAASNFDILPVVGVSNQIPKFTADQHEVSDIITPSTEMLVKSSNLKSKEITVGSGFRLNSPYYYLEQKVVWGATAMMLSEFRSILLEFDHA